jgi:hypothetical protein
VQALEVLHVERGPDLDPMGEEELDVLVALASWRARGVRVRQLVDARNRRTPVDDPLDVGLDRHVAAGAEVAEGRHLQATCAILGARAPVCLEVADDQVDALLACKSGITEHLIGLAHTCGGAEVDAQLPA